MKKILIAIIIAVFVAGLAAPVVLAEEENKPQDECKTWGCIKNMFRDRGDKDEG